MVVRRGFVQDVSDEDVRQRLAGIRERQAEHGLSDYDRLREILHSGDGDDRSAEVTDIISGMEVENRQSAEVQLVYEARNRYLHAVAEGLLARVRAGRTLFYGVDDILASVNFNLEDDALLDMALAELRARTTRGSCRIRSWPTCGRAHDRRAVGSRTAVA